MDTHLSAAQAAAIEASALSLVFDALRMVREKPHGRPARATDAHRCAALAVVMTATVCATRSVWDRTITTEAQAVSLAQTIGMGPEIGPLVNHWQETLGVRLVFASPGERLVDKARREFIDQVAQINTHTHKGDPLDGEVAVDVLSGLVRAARLIQGMGDSYPFKADVPGHVAPEGGQL